MQLACQDTLQNRRIKNEHYIVPYAHSSTLRQEANISILIPLEISSINNNWQSIRRMCHLTKHIDPLQIFPSFCILYVYSEEIILCIVVDGCSMESF